MNILISIFRWIAFWAVLRWIAFWAVVASLIMLTLGLLPSDFNLDQIPSPIAKALRGDVGDLSKANFVYALAALLLAVAAGLVVAYGFIYVALARLLAADARRHIQRVTRGAKTPAERHHLFAVSFDELRQKLHDHPLVGHAFTEFCETLLETDREEIRNTVRPQGFFHAGLAREKLPALKLMNAVPGYFVGIGLLLTFIGLVLALGKAGQAASAGNAADMQKAMTELLNIATFKFATSIAGLFSSIVLSFVFRLYSIAIETAFDKFSAALESGLLYTAPQSISADMRDIAREQLRELRDITQGDFFARMGEQIAPRMSEAIGTAIAPVAASIDRAIGSLKASSDDGMSELLSKFGDTLRQGAGTEMHALAATLGQMEKTLAAMQNDLRGSGEDFGRRMAEASEQLKTFIEEAGRSFGRSSTESRDALASVAATLKDTLERANADVAVGLGNAAGGASARLEEAMGVVMGKLDGQIGALGERLSAMQAAMERQAQASDGQQAAQSALMGRAAEQAATTQARMQEGLATAMEEIGARLNRAVELAVGLIGERFDALLRQMQAVEAALGHQRSALEGTASEARKTADALGSTAQDIRIAAAPLSQVGDRFATASESMSSNIDRSTAALGQMQAQMTALAGGLQATNDKTQAFWSDFKGKFDEVDTALGHAVTILSTSTADQSQLLKQQVNDVDSALAKAISGLNPLLDDIRSTAGEIADSLKSREQHARNGYHNEAR
jgi:uncharacterized protein YoxC